LHIEVSEEHSLAISSISGVYELRSTAQDKGLISTFELELSSYSKIQSILSKNGFFTEF
jgi:hypothetical protein